MENYVENSFVLKHVLKVFTYFSPATMVIVMAITIWIFNYNRKRSRLLHYIEKIPGPPGLPFFGESHALDVSYDRPLLQLFFFFF